jgi:hydroxymethylpyrimidine/phosphomethylpyrimidine kinase
MKLPRILIIGGSDSGGGAGIEADIKTVTLLGGYAMTAITAITIQDTQKLWLLEPVPSRIVRLAIEVAVQDIGVDVIKIGMLGSSALIKDIAAVLPLDVPLILDPVLVSTSGATLVPEGAIEALRKYLLPRSLLVTPNLPEAVALTGIQVTTGAEAVQAAEALRLMGAQAVLIKGGHAAEVTVVDMLVTAQETMKFSHPRIATRHTHGTGCALASAIATGIGQGLDLPDAITRASKFLQAALKNPPGYGKGHGPIGHYAGRGL